MGVSCLILKVEALPVARHSLPMVCAGPPCLTGHERTGLKVPRRLGQGEPGL